MFADSTNIAEKITHQLDAAPQAPISATLVNLSLHEFRDTATAMRPVSNFELNHFTISGAKIPDNDRVQASESIVDSPRVTNDIVVTDQTMARSATAIKNIEDYLTAPDTAPQDKLKSAGILASNGINELTGADGTNYKFNINDQNVVTLKSTSSIGRLLEVIGKLSPDGNQVITCGGTDSSGAGQTTGKDHDSANPSSRHNEKSADKPDEAGDRNKLHGTPDQLKQLDASRERLKKDAAANIENPQDREKFTKDMEALEQQAKSQPLSAREVSETYDQLSKLLEAKNGAVPKHDRVLAAETFAHHMGDPTNIDQGYHYTCNMTSLEEHLITRNPSKAAEIIATMAITGHWKAPDGKVIKITPGSLVPGVEERNNPPADGKRSYATQLMNLALINDTEQRKIPPEFYSQERPKNPGDTGERLRYADGSNVSYDDVLHNGNKRAYNAPDINCSEISREGQSINGEGKFVIANGREDRGAGVVHINSPEDLRRTLADMKARHKLPAIIEVDANSAAFGGDPSRGPGWHVVSITDYDEKTGKVHISNQWGKDSDRDMTSEDLYDSTYTKARKTNRNRS